MPKKDIVVMGASAGGLEALREIIGELPQSYRGAVFVVLHMSPDTPTVLDKILNRASQVPVRLATDGASIQAGQVLVARPDHHLVLNNGRVRVTRGPRENRHRPSIDVLFRSAARYYGPRTVAVLLSGMRTDGVSGLMAVKSVGGTVIVQEPRDAAFPELPASGIAMDHPDHVMNASEIAQELVRLSSEAAGKEVPISMEMDKEVRYSENQSGAQETPPGHVSEFACPDCNGSMWELKEGELVRYRCRVGHSFTEDTLVRSKEEQLENALWAALRSLEESAAIEKRAADSAVAQKNPRAADRLRENAQVKIDHAKVLRDLLLRTGITELEQSGTAD